MNELLRPTLAFMVLVFCLALAGCAGTIKNMKEIENTDFVVIPEPGKSAIVFMRPETSGFAVQASVFEIEGHLPKLVGIVAAETKVAYQIDPGQHIFMAIAESAEFMSADLLPNKVYYALVTPRMGIWKARFSLDPVHEDQLDKSDFDDWYEDCRWVEKNAESLNWAQNNMPSIRAKQDEYYPEWLQLDKSEKQHLFPIDGK